MLLRPTIATPGRSARGALGLTIEFRTTEFRTTELRRIDSLRAATERRTTAAQENRNHHFQILISSFDLKQIQGQHRVAR
jgi:hypothetical protein